MLLTLGIAIFLLDARAATVVYVGAPEGDRATLQQVQMAAQVYGLDLVTVRPDSGRTSILKLIRQPDTVAVVVDARALSAFADRELLAGFPATHSVPMLVAGIQEGQDPAQLKAWSGGVIGGATHFDAGADHVSYIVDDVPEVARQLSGVQLPTVANSGTSLALGGGAQVILEARFAGKTFPVFVRAARDKGAIFFAAQIPPVTIAAISDPYRQQAVFGSLAPVMMFLRYAAGDRAWHAIGNYANLTIDDLWLREPYGNVNYEALLNEMKQHKFHTTLAFIPWNYDRSEPALITMFAAHPQLYSICIHGNNHVHQEFGPLATHPLAKQIEDMRQAVARMEQFHTLTGISYDRVMVFPHSVAPVATFAQLKRANYLATANSLNVPSDSDPTSQAEIALRTTTLNYANFPSMRRYSAENDIPTSQLAIDSFLGNPILLYVHEGFFADGIDRFNKTADTVNRLDPATKWGSLGDVARHSYLERLRGDGNYDIKLLTAAADIRNTEDRQIVYFIGKTEDFSQPITVFVDGVPAPFQQVSNQLRLELRIGAGESRKVRIQYGDALNVAAVDISKGSLSIAVIRRLSDFRDNVISKSGLGRRFIRSYGDDNSIWNRAAEIAMAALLIAVTFLLLKRRRKSGGTLLVSATPSEQ